MTTPLAGLSAAGAEVDRLADLIASVPGVLDLGGGGPLQPVTYLPGRRVSGIRISEERIEVALVVVEGLPVLEVADRVRGAVAEAGWLRPVDIAIIDLGPTTTQDIGAAGPLTPAAGDGGAPPAASHDRPALYPT